FSSGITPADRHQAGHFLFSEADFLASKFRERKIFDFERLASGFASFIKSVGSFDSDGHKGLLFFGFYFVRRDAATNKEGPFAFDSGGIGRQRISLNPAACNNSVICVSLKPNQTRPIVRRYCSRECGLISG